MNVLSNLRKIKILHKVQSHYNHPVPVEFYYNLDDFFLIDGDTEIPLKEFIVDVSREIHALKFEVEVIKQSLGGASGSDSTK